MTTTWLISPLTQSNQSSRIRLAAITILALTVVSAVTGCAQSQNTRTSQETPQVVRVPVDTNAQQVSDNENQLY